MAENISNVAFLSFDANENGGGVQRVSYLLAKGFKQKGIESFLIYNKVSSSPSTFYKDKFLYNGTDDNIKLEKFIRDYKIKFIINNCVVTSVYTGAEIKNVIESCNCKMFSIIHAKPDLYKVIPSIYSLIWLLKKELSFRTKIISLLKLLFFPIYKFYSNKKYINWRKKIYDNSDKVVVLSEYYINNLCRMLKVTDSKVLSIPNPLNFEYLCTRKDVAQKKNEVLVVSRLEESSKGLSRVFKAWKLIEQNSSNLEWYLTIVGSGADMEYYKNMCTKLNLHRVRFEGHQNPFEYYKRSKIFIMSSFHEGFPMTLLEAEQMGLAIVAINNFESLQELVIDNFNGFLIRDDIKCLAQKLQELINNPSLCDKFAMASIEHSNLFSLNIILEKWFRLFNSMQNGVTSK